MSASGSARAIIAALLANAGIAAAKFVGFLITGSSSMLAESVHSLADTSNQGLLLLGQKRAAKQADELHPFGYGRARYFYSFVVALEQAAQLKKTESARKIARIFFISVHSPFSFFLFLRNINTFQGLRTVSSPFQFTDCLEFCLWGQPQFMVNPSRIFTTIACYSLHCQGFGVKRVS